MAITIKEAIEKSGIVLKELEDEKQIRANEFCKKLDDLIAANIHTILKKPIIKPLLAGEFYACPEVITSRYKDFTIEFTHMNGMVYIKLADKNWDMQGYGIPNVNNKTNKECAVKESKSWIKKLINYEL